jgi:hypothetical protein
VRQAPPGPQLLPPRGTLRFALGSSEGLRSNTWSVIGTQSMTGSQTTDEVYLASRYVMGSAKLSMHSSGRWRWAMTSQEAARRQLPPETDRVIVRWNEPLPIAEGWLRAASVCIPATSMRSLPGKRPPRTGVISLWEPSSDLCEVWFDIFIKRSGALPLTVENITEPVGRIGLPSGGALWVIGTEWPVTKERGAAIRDLRARARAFYVEREGAESFTQMRQPTGAVWGRDDDDGRPVVVDLGDLRGPA